MSGPSDLEQYYLELINEARLDPMASAARYISSYSPLASPDSDIQLALAYFGVSGTALLSAFQSLTAVAPLAWNDNLAAASRLHDQAMINADTQSHQLPGELPFNKRDEAAGYTGWTRLSEIVYAHAYSPLYGLAGFMVDWGDGPDGMQNPAGHRLAIMDGALTEIGIGVLLDSDPATDVGPQVVTGDLGARNHRFALGVAYTDSDGNDFYTPGEGRSDLVVSTGGVSATSTASGGYALDLPNPAGGLDRTFTFTGGGLAHAASISVYVLSDNAKFDVVNGTTLRTSQSGIVTGFAQIEVLGSTRLAIIAGDGSQTFVGGSGGDDFIGGAGIDTAVYGGARSNYTITRDTEGTYTVQDNRTGVIGDGNDHLTSVERLRFADGTISIKADGDINADGTTDILFRGPDGKIAYWSLNDTTIVDGGFTLIQTTDRLLAVADVNFGLGAADGPDLLFRAADGQLNFAENVAGHYYGTGSTFGNSGTAYVGSGDFDGDGRADILYRDPASGAYSLWMSYSSGPPVTVGLGSPGANWLLKAVGDFDGDGHSDLLFENAAGVYAVWQLGGSGLVGGGAIGNPGDGWFFEGNGDFNGDGKQDMLFQNAAGQYAIWDLSGTAIIGGGTIGNPGNGYTLAAIGDYNGDGYSDMLFRSVAGTYVSWDLHDTAIIGGGTIGNPGAGYELATSLSMPGFASMVFTNASGAVASWVIGGNTIVGGATLGNAGTAAHAFATADFFGTGETDILFGTDDGTIAVWRTNGSDVVGTSVIGNPGAGWSTIAAADFNGDGRDDLLLHNAASGTYATWDMAGTAIVGGGTIGAAAGYSFMAAGDINGDGHADILFRNDATGSFAAWLMQDTVIVGGGEIGNPGGTMQFAGLGDFDGNGKADLLFKDAAGNYAEWSLDGTHIAGGGTIGNPGGDWQLAAIADVNQDGRDDLVFVNAAGTYATWVLDGNTILSGGVLGSAGSGWHVV